MHNFQPVHIATPILTASSPQQQSNQHPVQASPVVVTGQRSTVVLVSNEQLQDKHPVDDDCRSNGGDSSISSSSDDRFSVLSDRGPRGRADSSKKSDVAPAPDYIPLRTTNVTVPIGPHGGNQKQKGVLNVTTDSSNIENNGNTNKRKRENCASTYNFNQSRYELTREYGGTPWKPVGKIYSAALVG